jgi:hypothetical protein
LGLVHEIDQAVFDDRGQRIATTLGPDRAIECQEMILLFPPVTNTRL